MLPLAMGFTFMEWVQTYGPEIELPVKKRPNALLEEALCKYFRTNTEKILEIQHKYMEKGQGIDLVTATEYAIREDIQDPSQNIANLNPLESAIQLVVGMENASREGGPFDENKIIMIMRAGSKEFRQQENYQETMGLYAQVAQCYSHTLQRYFLRFLDKPA